MGRVGRPVTGWRFSFSTAAIGLTSESMILDKDDTPGDAASIEDEVEAVILDGGGLGLVLSDGVSWKTVKLLIVMFKI